MQNVITCGPATAVLVEDRPGDAADRDGPAAAALQLATGRADISISRRPSGRPRLGPPYHELGVSLASRHGILMAGFAPHQCIGVDLEVDGPDVGCDPAGLARDHFTTGEADAIARLAAGDARDLFLRFWVVKEAALKATGRGIVDGLHWPDLTDASRHLQAGLPVRLESPRAAMLEVAHARLLIGGATNVYCALAVLDRSQQ